MWVYSDQLLVLPYVTATVVGGIGQNYCHAIDRQLARSWRRVPGLPGM